MGKVYNDLEFRSMDDIKDFIYDVLKKAVLSGDVNPGEYIVMDDDSMLIGYASDFDSDVLMYATPVDSVVDFDTLDSGEDVFIDLSEINFEKFLN